MFKWFKKWFVGKTTFHFKIYGKDGAFVAEVYIKANKIMYPHHIIKLHEGRMELDVKP